MIQISIELGSIAICLLENINTSVLLLLISIPKCLLLISCSFKSVCKSSSVCAESTVSSAYF